MNERYVILGYIRTLEPVAITYRKGKKGGYVETLKYIPSSTILGSIISYIGSEIENKEITYQDFPREYGEALFTPAFPVDFQGRIKIEDPLPLPFKTIAKDKNGKHVSVAIKWAEFFDKLDKEVLNYLTSLDYKVEYGFWYFDGNDVRRFAPKTITYTHVALSYSTRTSLKGYLYTVEALSPGETFVFKACISERLFETLRETDPVTLKIGSAKSRGYGLVKITIDNSVSLGDYIDGRYEKVKSMLDENNYITVDFVSEASIKKLEDLKKKALYHRIMVSRTKRYYSFHGENGELVEKFYMMSIVEPGSILVLRNVDLKELVRNEFPCPTHNNYLFFTSSITQINNPLHFVR